MATLSWKLHQVCTRHWLVRHCRPLGFQCVTRIRPEASVECTTVPHVGHACEYVQHCEPLFFFRGRRQGRQPLNPARGPLAVALPYGSSLLSVGERGRAPCRRPPRVAKNSRVLQCFVLVAFFPIFRILWLKMGQHGPT